MAENVDVTPVADSELAPSTENVEPNSTNAWDISALEEGLLKDGKLFGQFDSLAALHKGYKELQDKHTQLNRDIKHKERDDSKHLEEIRAEQQRNELASQTMNDLVGTILNEQSLSEEQTAKMQELGIDMRDVKLQAYEAREVLNKAYSSVGGKEAYEEMRSWANETLSDKEKEEFNKNLSGASADIYIQGLKVKYEMSKGQPKPEAQTQQQQAERVSGTPVAQTIKGYLTQKEMLDATTLANGSMRYDKEFVRMHKERLAKTSREVIGY